jgi:hypothetical protein
MTDPANPETDFTLYVFQASNVIRTGCLLFYDPLMYSDLANMTLTQLSTYNPVIPGTDAATNIFPAGVNAQAFTLTINR